MPLDAKGGRSMSQKGKALCAARKGMSPLVGGGGGGMTEMCGGLDTVPHEKKKVAKSGKKKKTNH